MFVILRIMTLPTRVSGVEDNGVLAGLDDGDMEASLDTLQRMAQRYD